jgi:hypothetical protein
MVALGGAALWLLGRTIGLAPVHRRVEAAAEELVAEAARLAAGAPPSERALAAAVALLRDAHHAPGPYTAATFEADEMAKRLGDALPVVVEVEKMLIEEGRIYRVFTSAPKPEGEPPPDS